MLFCGDLLFNGGTPFLLMGSVTGAIDVLTSVLAPIPARTIVPGHGSPCSRDLIGVVVGYLRLVLDAAQAGWPPDCHRSRLPAIPALAITRTGWTVSASSATCTAPTTILTTGSPSRTGSWR